MHVCMPATVNPTRTGWLLILGTTEELSCCRQEGASRCSTGHLCATASQSPLINATNYFRCFTHVLRGVTGRTASDYARPSVLPSRAGGDRVSTRLACTCGDLFVVPHLQHGTPVTAPCCRAVDPHACTAHAAARIMKQGCSCPGARLHQRWPLLLCQSHMDESGPPNFNGLHGSVWRVQAASVCDIPR